MSAPVVSAPGLRAGGAGKTLRMFLMVFRVVVYGILTVWAVLFLLGQVEAAATGLTCSHVRVDGVDGFAIWAVYRDGVVLDADGTCPAPGSVLDVDSGNALSLHCKRTNNGNVPPAAEDTISIRGYSDNANFNAPAVAGLWVNSFGVNGCDAEQTFSRSCTADGTAGGASRYGIVRLMIRAQQNDIPAYDDNSDAEEWGIYRCRPAVTAFTDGNVASSPTVYVPTDTLRTSITADSAAYKAGTNARVDIVCSTATNADGTFEVSSLPVTGDIRLDGSLTTWPDDCSLVQRAAGTTFSAVNGYGAQNYLEWDTAGPPAGVTFPDARTAQRTAKSYDRTAAASACTSSLERMNRLETTAITCTWRDARNALLNAGDLATCFARRSAQAAFDTTDFASDDFTIAASGGMTGCNLLARITSFHTNDTAPLDYVVDIKTFDSSRTDAELEHVGSTEGILDVSSLYVIRAVVHSKTFDGSTGNSTGFVMGADSEFLSLRSLRGARGQSIASATLSCFRTRPDAMTEDPVSMGLTDASGSTAFVEFQVTAPSGTWQFDCDTTHDGNIAQFAFTYDVISPLSSDHSMFMHARVWNVSGAVFLNVTVGGARWNPDLDALQFLPPDGFIGENTGEVRGYLLAISVNDPTVHATVANNLAMFPLDGAGERWYLNHSLAADGWASAVGIVKMNLSGKTFVSSVNVPLIEAPPLTDVTLSTALDDFVPLLIWGGLAMLFMARNAWLPLSVVFLNAVAGMPEEPLWGLTASFMFLLIALGAHAIGTNRGNLLRPGAIDR